MGNNKEQKKDVREEGFGDDGGTRVGRPDSAARLSEDATSRGIEGSIVEQGTDEESQGPNQDRVQRDSGRDPH
jgi:hypothetical protein